MNYDHLSLDEYLRLAARSASPGGASQRRLMVAALGLAGEAGEFANLVK